MTDPYSRMARDHAREMWDAEERRCKREHRIRLICIAYGAAAASAFWVAAIAMHWTSSLAL